jgi:hypothetical protein
VIFLVGYIAAIFGANWAISTFGMIPVGFGLLALASVYFAWRESEGTERFLDRRVYRERLFAIATVPASELDSLHSEAMVSHSC